MSVDPSSADMPAITAITETALFPTIFTPIGPMEPRAGKVWKLTVGGTCTTGLAGTLIITPRLGLVIGGVSIGPSPAQNYVPSIAVAPFLLEYYLQFRTIQIAAGATSTCIGWGRWSSGGAVATASSETAVMIGGAAPVNVDISVASALWMGVTFSVAPSVVTRSVIWQPLN